MDNGKCAPYTRELEVLERLYHECPKPISKSLVVEVLYVLESLF